MGDEDTRSVVTCPTCFSKDHTLLVVSTDPFELQPWCTNCRETLGPTLKPTTEAFSWLHQHNRQ